MLSINLSEKAINTCITNYLNRMKITIDTKHDSKEEIEHAIRLLQGMIEHAEEAKQGDLPVTGDNIMSMFDSAAPSIAKPEEKKQEQADDDDEEEFTENLQTYDD